MTVPDHMPKPIKKALASNEVSTHGIPSTWATQPASEKGGVETGGEKSTETTQTQASAENTCGGLRTFVGTNPVEGEYLKPWGSLESTAKCGAVALWV